MANDATLGKYLKVGAISQTIEIFILIALMTLFGAGLINAIVSIATKPWDIFNTLGNLMLLGIGVMSGVVFYALLMGFITKSATNLVMKTKHHVGVLGIFVMSLVMLMVNIVCAAVLVIFVGGSLLADITTLMGAFTIPALLLFIPIQGVLFIVAFLFFAIIKGFFGVLLTNSLKH